MHSAARQPAGTGSAQILRNMSPKSRRVRCPFGRGVPKDYAEAVRWYHLAADQGAANAQGNLGIMYALGWGVPQDDDEAHMWPNLAAAQSSGADRERLVKARDAAAESITPDQLAEAQRLAREWDAAHPREP